MVDCLKIIHFVHRMIDKISIFSQILYGILKDGKYPDYLQTKTPHYAVLKKLNVERKRESNVRQQQQHLILMKKTK